MALTAKYIDWDIAGGGVAGLSDISILTTDLKDSIIQRVEILKIEAGLNRDFAQGTVAIGDPELHSPGDNQDFLILNNFPVIAVTRLRDNIQATVASSIITLIEHTNFEIEKEKGIIRLIPDVFDSTIMKQISEFTAGYNTVDVCYTYGYASAPGDICAFANLLAGKLIRMWYEKMYESSGAEDYEEIEMGDYSKKVGKLYQLVYKQYKDELDEQWMNLRTKYGNFVTS